MAGGKHVLGLPGGKHLFGTARVGEKGQIVIPKEARALFDIHTGDTLLLLGDEQNGILITRPDVLNGVALKILNSWSGETAEDHREDATDE